jgi:hypothetical protein
MSKANGKEVSYGALHGPIFVPGLGQIGPTLSSASSGSLKAVKMTVDEPFVMLEVADKMGKTVELPVPISQFTHMVVKS